MTTQAVNLVDALAALLEYPSAGFSALLEACRDYASTADPEIKVGLERFALGVHGLSAVQMQELYTETFDFSESCTMDIGWHLFGDRHERGMFLSDLRPVLAAAGITELLELPDYLPHLLLLLSRSDPSQNTELREKIRRGVETLRAGLHERRSPYEHLVTSAFAAATGA
jgi:nitrate reductase delta subunit